MNCLHICNDFSYSKVHRNLYVKLDKLNITQTVYNPIRKNSDTKSNTIDYIEKQAKTINSTPLKKMHRYFFRKKIIFLFNDLNNKINLNNIDLVHATTLFSDGAVALKIHNKYNKPFIVAVRGTDLSVFLRLRPDLVFIVREILEKASKIVFMSNSIQDNFLNHYLIKHKKNSIEKKSIIIYNGIDNFWIKNQTTIKKEKPFKVTYVGRFLPTKNIPNLINAMLMLKKEGVKCELNIIGNQGEDENKVKLLAKENNNWINFIGPIKEKSKLLQLYRENHIFAMPSTSETFGLVYIEALSQGLPVLYNIGQGIDGVFNTLIGEKCNGNSVSDIKESLKNIINNYQKYNISTIDFNTFNWDKIARRYKNIYLECIQLNIKK
ncbi:glycosyltransferase involved in cell wall biosynthesis [Maribacter vaceletii]|uniref:Glycosyltransferase involved in cell wall biosynthesis n=1 Tax=Maribacter vaceletii TaxID=1206816 RepID=A0A495DU65_9FLAO|nr:glycosyltransferase family 4 protein [Maribacter vaceletii]RKR07183.1 glycosyltransferase involved in cell wall biosynthesis [Maribacter vaceletii]